MKKILILLLLIPSLSWGVNCNFPIIMKGSIITQQGWNDIMREAKNMIKESGMSKSQIIKLAKEEVSNIFDNPDSLNEMREKSEKLCNELGPIEYKSMQRCGTKLLKKGASQLGFNSSWFLQQNKKIQKLMPICSSTVRTNNDKSNETFDGFCKNARLEDLDKDVALLCIEKIK